MATAAATTDKKKVSTSSHIPDDLTFSILSKLPIKSLTRFAFVQKSWSLLFQNSIFMNTFCTNFFFKSKQYEEEDDNMLPAQSYMLSFDFSTEIFFSTNLPSESDILPPLTLRERNLLMRPIGAGKSHIFIRKQDNDLAWFVCRF